MVHVLVSEAFFQSRIVDTLNALVLAPRLADMTLEDDAFLEAVAGVAAQGVVVDLEEEERDLLPLLARLKEDPRTASWHWLCYCSYEREELVSDAARLGLDAVPRSTFASSLVRLLQGFTVRDEA